MRISRIDLLGLVTMFLRRSNNQAELPGIELPLDKDISIEREKHGDHVFLRAVWKRQIIAGEAILRSRGRAIEIELIEVFDNRLFRAKSFRRPEIRMNFRRKGLGQILLSASLDYAREQEFSEIFGFILPIGLTSNPKLREWYSSEGFEVTDPDERCPFGKGAVAMISMEL